MRTIIILCSLLALVAGCSGAKTAPAQAPPPATQGGQGLDRPRGGDAIAAYREAIRRSPNDAELHYHLGVAYAKEGRLEQAIASYRQAIALEPQYAEAYEGLGLAYDRSGQAEKAAAAAREAGRLKAEYAELHYHLGLAYAKEGRLEQAMATYRKALALKPDHPGAREGLLALTGAAGHEPGASPARQERAPGLPEGATETAPAESVTPPVTLAVEPPPVASGAPAPEPDASSSTASGATRPEAPGAPPEAPSLTLPPSPPVPIPSRPESPPFVAREQRTALVIGNAAYREEPLRNAVHDAAGMAAALRQLGFQVVELHDAAHQQMEEGVEQFTRQLGRGGVGLFYFSGHGVQVNGQNYLVPVGARILRETDVRYQAVQVDWVLDRMHEAGNEVNIIVLDACRNNPYARSWRSGQPGLAPIQAASGALLAYATAPGMTAEDGPGRNGTYTKHLLSFIQVPRLSAEEMFKEVRVAVARETGKKQIPWVSTSLLGDFYFAGR
jgi:tetratricopeptide (TPR) repeat protein